jgi:hypothetical protein
MSEPDDLPPRPEPDRVEYSEGGQPIYRYKDAPEPGELVHGDDSLIKAVGNHIDKHLGGNNTVFHEVVSTNVHIDVHVCEPTPERPFIVLVTSGMAERPMYAPEGAEACQFAELCICLPPDWPGLDAKSMSVSPTTKGHPWHDEANYWPIRWLKQLARFPHEYKTWLWWGHTIPSGDPPEPYAANTQLCGMMLTFNPLLPEDFHMLKLGDRDIMFFTLMPLYAEEMDFKLKHKAEELEKLFDQHQVLPVVDLNRVNVAGSKSKQWWKFW